MGKKKWNFDTINQVITESGDQLLSTGEINAFTNLRILCGLCQQEYEQVFKYYNKGAQGNCMCSKRKILNVNQVRAYIETNGETLVDAQYTNTKTLLSIVCKICTKTYLQTFLRYTQGYRHRDCTRYKIENVHRPITMVQKRCIQCEQDFSIAKAKKNQRMCSQECIEAYRKSEIHLANCRKGGLAAVKVSSPRSKSEIYFAELCSKQFKNVVTNVQMFDGWDADVILLDHKIAVHWNGIWHYEVVRKGMDLEKTQQRDCIKNKVIEKYGYISYTIKDMGSHKKNFVEKEFETFVNFVEFLNFDSD